MTDQYLLDPEEEAACINAVLITRASDQDIFRAFSADVELYDGSNTYVTMGSIRGLIGWQVEGQTVWADADAISVDADLLGWAADQIVEWLEVFRDVYVHTVVMIERLQLEPRFRGQRLTKGIINELVEVLALEPTTTLIVLQPEPQKDGGGWLPEGPEHDGALARLRRAYEDQGFERLDETLVWWRLAAG